MNVEDALNTASSLESHFGMKYGHENDEMENFGHPETPRLALHKLANNEHNDDILLLVAYTKHCVTAQLLLSSANQSSETSLSPVLHVGDVVSPAEDTDDDPIRELSSSEKHDEVIKSLIVLELENPSICSNQVPSSTGMVSSFVLAIVLGTNQGRVLTSEVIVQQNLNEKNQWSLECQSSNHGVRFLEVLPRDSDTVAQSIQRKNKNLKTPGGSPDTMVPFQPLGGISSISCAFDIAVNPLETQTTYVWITFVDGSIVRMHHAALFPSIWAEGADSNVSVDDLLFQYNHTALLRCQVRLPPGDEQSLSIIPLPKYYPSPLAPVNVEDVKNHGRSTHEACYEALVFGSSDSFPTLCVYTSEDQFWEPQPEKKSDSLMVDVVLGGTKAIVGGVVGALRWATSTEQSTAEPGNSDDQVIPSTPFPSIWKMPVSLFAGPEFHDVPRIIEHCSIDPGGQHAALSDGLGRVLLFDLSTKQIIRMWKGLRQASCIWSKSLNKSTDGRSKSHLVVHSRQRRVVEVWPSRSGGRLASFQVHRGSTIVSCSGRPRNQQQSQESIWSGRDHYAFVLDSIDPSGAATALKRIDVSNIEINTEAPRKSGGANSTSRSREATMRVQHLKQLLSAEKDMLCTKDDVFDAFSRIKSLNDLSSCLDVVAKATVLEDDMSVDGASFQKLALKYCSKVLAEATNEAMEISSSAAVTNLSKKVDFYTRIIKAYDIVKGYESAALDEGAHANKALSNFAREALGWATTYETVTKTGFDSQLRFEDSGNLRFHQFASSCVFPENGSVPAGNMRIYLSESTRTRQEILIFLFRPLLGWFSSGIVGSVFEVLGIRDDFAYVLKCFGEWFMTLRIKQIQDRCLTLPDSPMSRFLRDSIEREFNSGTGSPTAIDSLSFLCEQSTDLTRAFMLATLSREVQLQISRQKEDAAFATADISKWCALVKQLDQSRELLESLLRKLRVCLYVSLRLHGEDLAPFPLSVRNVERESDYSVYKWVALDELKISRNHEEIVSLETASDLTTHSFDPASSESDEPEKFYLLQKSCTDRGRHSNEPDQSGSMLLFLRPFNKPGPLAAHRSLLLAFEWVRDPKYLQILRHAIAALKSLPSSSFSYAVRLEVWCRVVAPVYRALLSGFSDIPEIKEEDAAPLFESREWLSEFGRMALQILTLLGETPFKEGFEPEEELEQPKAEGGRIVWPPVIADYTLGLLRKKARKVESTAVDMHVVVVCALLFSDDREGLSSCVPGIDGCFQPASLFHIASLPNSKDTRQEKFLCDAVVSFAQELHGGPIDNFGVLGELNQLASRWGYEKKWLQTTFLTVMYELGKDKDVDEIMTACSPHVLAQQLVVAGVNIVCQRLDYFLISSKSRGEARSVMGLLDAELCEWVNQRSETAEPLVSSLAVDVPLATTQILTIRLLSLASGSNGDPAIRARIHALSVLAGTLVKAMENHA